MSDLADKCSASVAEIEGAGGSFRSGARASACLSRSNLSSCSCGGHPRFVPAGRAERLVCQACGNSVGPLLSRQMLGEDWNAYGRWNGRPS